MVTQDKTLAILVGGRSLRMGQDKGLLKVQGEPLIIRHIRRLGDHYKEVLVICSSQSQKRKYEALLHHHPTSSSRKQVRVIVDQAADQRAAHHGLKAALLDCIHASVTVLPVDAAGLDINLLSRLNTGHNDPSAFKSQNGEIVPFPSQWHKENLDLLNSDDLSIIRTLKAHPHTQWLQTTQAEEHLLGVNINTPEDVLNYYGESIKDAWGRQLKYLRLSLTEACNMSCQYCLPKGYPDWRNAKHMMSAEHACTLLKAFRQLGFSKVRFTGGEPAIHRDFGAIIETARGLGYETISITTNGTLIRSLKQLQDQGLTHLNVSLDALDAEDFYKITGSRSHKKILHLIDEAIELDITVKINTVLLRQINFKEVHNLIKWAGSKPITLRFIELMSTGINKKYHKQWYVSNQEIQDIASKLGYQPSSRVTDKEPVGPASLYDHPTLPGRLGFISPMSCSFCDRCNRLRVTAKARLRLCLFSEQENTLPVEEGPQKVARTIKDAILHKPEKHYLNLGRHGNVQHFRAIGG